MALDTTLDEATGQRPRILVVDDEPINIRVLHRLLKAEFELLMATSGEEAVRVCDESRPSLVLMDVVMPGMGGEEACTRIHALPGCGELPVVFVSAQSTEDQARITAAAGAADMISKPVDPERLLACVHRLIDGADA